MRLGCVRLGRILVAELIGFNEAEAHAPRMHVGRQHGQQRHAALQ